jgi:hypothetical protein
MQLDKMADPPAHIGFRFNQIDTVVSRLGTVFTDRNALMKKEWAAATIVNTKIKGFLARRRWKIGRAALSRWWSRAGKPFFDLLTQHVEYHGELKQREEQVLTNRVTRRLGEIVKRWRRVTVRNRPENEERRRQVALMMMIRSEQQLKACFVAWKKCAKGVGSRRNVVRNYKLRLAQARAHLKSSGKIEGVIIKERLQKEMHKDATRRIQSRHMEYMVRYVFYCWMDVSVHKNHHFLRKALRFYFQRAARRAFDCWKHYRQMSFDQGAAWRVSRRKVFRPKINMRAVRLFHRRHLLKRVLKCLHRYCHPRAVATRHIEQTATVMCTRVIHAWRAQTVWSLRARRVCVDEWKDYSRRLCAVPFQAWYLWAAKRRTKLHGQQILISAFHRRQRTHKMYQIFRLWKHLSVYGKLEGTKSRVDLIRALDEQNKFAESLEDTVDELQDELVNVTQNLKNQEETNHVQIAEQQLLHTQLEQYKFALHAAELEIARLQALQDSIARCYPKTVTRLKQAQTLFFKKLREDHMRSGERAMGDDEPEFEALSRKRAKDTFGIAAIVTREKAEKVEKYRKAGTSPFRNSNEQHKNVSHADARLLRRLKLALSDFGFAESAHHTHTPNAKLDNTSMASDDKNLSAFDSRLLSFLATGKVKQAQVKQSDQQVANNSDSVDAGTDNEEKEKDENEATDWKMDEMMERQNWNELLQEFTLLYPMRHPINKTAKSSIQNRIAKVKSMSRENYNNRVNVFSREEEVPD